MELSRLKFCSRKLSLTLRHLEKNYKLLVLVSDVGILTEILLFAFLSLAVLGLCVELRHLCFGLDLVKTVLEATSAKTRVGCRKYEHGHYFSR